MIDLHKSRSRSMEKKGDTNDAACPTIWLYMLCRRYSIWIRNICLMYKYRVYNNLFWIFLIQMEYRLQSMYNHMVGRAASFVSLFYSIFLGQYSVKFCRQSLEGKLLKPNKVISSWHKHVFSCEQRQETCSSDLDAEHSNAVSR